MTLDTSDLRGLDAQLEQVVSLLAQRRRVLLVGPVGCGRTMLARRLPAILGPLADFERGVLSERYRSAVLRRDEITERPFRAPHHTCSATALAKEHRGEVWLAEHGILYLDELPEFRRPALDDTFAALAANELQTLIVGSATTCPCGRPACVCEDSARARWGALTRDFSSRTARTTSPILVWGVHAGGDVVVHSSGRRMPR